MRIEGALLEDLAGVGFAPDAEVSVPFDGFTEIVGRNDVGKSRLGMPAGRGATTSANATRRILATVLVVSEDVDVARCLCRAC